MFSHKSRLYLHPLKEALTTSTGVTGSCLLPSGIVVEPSPVRGLAADRPIHIIFKPSHSHIFHCHVVVNMALRVSQQFNQFVIFLHYCSENQWYILVLQFHEPSSSLLFAIIKPAPQSIMALPPSADSNRIFPCSSVYQLETVDNSWFFNTSICPFSRSAYKVPFALKTFARSYT